MKSLTPPLSPGEADVYYKFTKEKKSHKTIAKERGSDEQTTKNQMWSARAKIKACANRCKGCGADCPKKGD